MVVLNLWMMNMVKKSRVQSYKHVITLSECTEPYPDPILNFKPSSKLYTVNKATLLLLPAILPRRSLRCFLTCIWSHADCAAVYNSWQTWRRIHTANTTIEVVTLAATRLDLNAIRKEGQGCTRMSWSCYSKQLWHVLLFLLEDSFQARNDNRHVRVYVDLTSGENSIWVDVSYK